MQKVPLSTILGCGLTASLCMLAFLYLVHLFAAGSINVFSMLSTITTKGPWWLAPGQFYLLSGFLFPIIYGRLLYRDLAGPPWRRGLSFGLILFALRGLIVAPVLDQGLFSLDMPLPWLHFFALLGAHIVYGIALGASMGDWTKRGTVRPPAKQGARQRY